MSYHHVVSFRVGSQLHTDLLALAAERHTDVGKLLRGLIHRELRGAGNNAVEEREMIIFIAIAIDGLLGTNPDPELRPTIIKLWRERLAADQADGR